ncbi:hypothetical protein [Rhodoferax lacus]|nr:hypothetical protein [Rhodoferax lacus]
MRKIVAPALARLYMGSFYLAMPVMPLLASLLFLRSKYVLEYRSTFKKLRIHAAAMQEGPAEHYFHDVMGRSPTVPQEIHGTCVQCGNCCMDRRCVFLEDVGGDKYQCGIYQSPFRKLSNCGSFPLNQRDIDRYACPSYTAGAVIPIHPERAAGVGYASRVPAP